MSIGNTNQQRESNCGYITKSKKSTEMTNNKQQTAVEWLEKQTRKPEWHSLKRGDIFEQAKEKYEHEMCLFADEYASYVQEQSKEGIKGAMVSMCAWTFFKNRRK
jgi:hypothetical protein